jgi:sugar phosphate isomerase/epimerase
MNPLSRRQFLRDSALASVGMAAWAAATGPLLAGEPFKRIMEGHIRPSLCAYSFRDRFKFQDGKTLANGSLDMFQFVDYCAREGWDGAELTSYYFPPDADASYFARLKRHCALAGVSVSGSSVGSVLTLPSGEKRDAEISHVKKWLQNAARLGAPYLRVFAGGHGSASVEEARKWCVDALVECAAEGEKEGVLLGLEDHGGISATPDGILAIIKPAQTEWLGINLDVGNFDAEDPYDAIQQCAPYAVNVHWKPVMKGWKSAVPRPSDWPRIVKILRAAGYHGYLALEYELKEDPESAVPNLLKKTRDALAA